MKHSKKVIANLNKIVLDQEEGWNWGGRRIMGKKSIKAETQKTKEVVLLFFIAFYDKN